MIGVTMGCSSAKNTARSRWWQAFNTRYNVYYNGSQAYIEGSLEKETGNKDNFTEMIPLYTVGNKASRELGKSNFDIAITKAEKAIHLHSIKRKPEWNHNRTKTPRDREWLSRREYNPFLWKVWMLMGRSQFHEGDFDGAASTFSYMSRLYETQPAIRMRAQAWLAKSYIENGYRYDAEDVIRNMQRDSIPWQARKEWDYTLADYYIHIADYAKAIPYLRNVIRHEMRRRQRAREWFLMGQICQAIGRNDEAYKAYSKVIGLNPPYDMEVNARVARTEVVPDTKTDKMIGQLRRMAKSDKNKDYVGQIYYAIGNIYLARKDTLNAINNYEKGNTESTNSGVEKGVLLLKLGNLYWIREQYGDARRCYNSALGMLDKERPDYEMLSERSKVLDELVPFTDAIHTQDSLQTLAKMDETQRNKAIDKVIEALKKKEKEEKHQQEEQAVAEAQQKGSNVNNANTASNRNIPTNSSQAGKSSTWYFYNPVAVTQGKQNFQRQWGKRENVDNWQRINKTVVADFGDNSVANLTDEQRDSIFNAQEKADSLSKVNTEAKNDPHQREYYLAQIPFTQEQVAASNAIIEDGLYNSGVIFKDKLDNLTLSEKALRRLTDNYPDYEHMDNAYYHLYLLYSRMGRSQMAQTYVAKLKEKYPNSQWTTLLSDPNYVENARNGVHLEDSLYAASYDAFKADKNDVVIDNDDISARRFPTGANRDKFMFIAALAKLNNGDSKACLTELDSLVAKFPTSQVSTMAGMIINGVKAGRTLHGGKFNIGEIWSRRTEVLSDSAEMKQKQLSNERNTQFVFMFVYPTDSVNENKLLYQLARYNFTSYMVRDFDITIDNDGDVHRMRVAGFRNYDEALQYARQVYNQRAIVALAQKARPIIISVDNLPLLGTVYSYDDYGKFYNKHFAPLKISTFNLFTEPVEVVKENSDKDAETQQPTETDVDTYLNNTFIGNDEPAPKNSSPVQINGTDIIIDEPASQTPATQTVIPVQDDETNPKTAVKPQRPTTIVPDNNTTKEVEKQEQPVKKDQSVKQAQTVKNGQNVKIEQNNKAQTAKKEQTDKKGQTDDKKGQTDQKQTNKKEQTDKKKQPAKQEPQKPVVFDFDDEYYDLDGF